MSQLVPARWIQVFGISGICFAMSACGGKAPTIPTFSVANGTVRVPSQVPPVQKFEVSGEFQDAGGNIRVNFPVYVEVRQKRSEGKTGLAAGANIKVVKAEKTTRSFKGQIAAPSEPGEYQVQAFAIKELIGECSLTVK